MSNKVHQNITRELTDSVICDICGVDYSNNIVDKGGIVFEDGWGGSAACPKCAAAVIHSLMLQGKLDDVQKVCDDKTTFADFIRRDVRGNKPGYIQVTTLEYK